MKLDICLLLTSVHQSLSPAISGPCYILDLGCLWCTSNGNPLLTFSAHSTSKCRPGHGPFVEQGGEQSVFLSFFHQLFICCLKAENYEGFPPVVSVSFFFQFFLWGGPGPSSRWRPRRPLVWPMPLASPDYGGHETGLVLQWPYTARPRAPKERSHCLDQPEPPLLLLVPLFRHLAIYIAI